MKPPHDPLGLPDPLDPEIRRGRREFLELMATTVGAVSLGACVKQPEEKIYPFVRAPENLIPGKPRFYATALPLGGVGRSVLVESHEGRPTKIEGNGGGTDVWMQAEILALYDPDRSQTILRRGAPSTRQRFVEEITPAFASVTEGKKTALLTGNVTSPTLAAQIVALKTALPGLEWYQWEPIHDDERRRATQLAYGRPLDTIYDFSKADVVVAFDADPLFSEAGAVRYARDAAARRQEPEDFSRWYVVESSPTCTGSFADHRVRAKRSAVGGYVRGLAARLGILESSERAGDALLDAMAEDLRRVGSRGLVVVGREQPADVQALTFEINERIGARNHTFVTIEPVSAAPVRHTDEIRRLVDGMNAGRIDTLVVFGANPVYDAPAELDFAAAYEKVERRVHLGLYPDETAQLSHWHLPARHALESWSDLVLYDGTVCIVQPLIAPLYGGHSPHELVATFANDPSRRDHDLVRARYAKKWGSDLDARWRRALHDGFVEGTRHVPVSTPPQHVPPVKPTAIDLEITFDPDPTVWDGGYANNAWLQELPKPFTKLTWDNAALVAPATARRLGLETADLVELAVGDRSTTAAVFVAAGQAEDSIALSLGGGRRRGGRLAPGAGFDAQRIRRADASWFAAVEVKKTGRRFPLVTTQAHHDMEGRHLVRSATLAEYAARPDFATAPDQRVAALSLYPEPKREGEQWGMSIALDSCTGCNACVLACQSENNIPVVGKEEVGRGREMHWLRIDAYTEGDALHHQPVTCMHCENAPCEVVCPVNATVHSPSGVNEMVYNRCVGTRYCSNNCPYKVRRFNFYLYQDWETPSLTALRNPDVSVRSRGVMEKCTFCIQRVQAARIDARRSDRALAEGDVVTACQGACPTQAITFGNVADPESAVSRQKASPLSYTLLDELNVKPRVSYRAKLTNPSPAVTESKEKKEKKG